ncbi:MAG: ATP-binding protein [Rhodobacterales bacterium]|nr:ATP-binding protein [Rhodobacterales bacterium]NCT13398.1 ATP-binding protein [Rhodobacterales bacterium]
MNLMVPQEAYADAGAALAGALAAVALRLEAAMAAEAAGVSAAAEAAARHAARSAAMARPTPLDRLARLFDLDPAEADLMLLALAEAADPHLGRRMAALDAAGQPGLTPALAERLTGAALRARLDPRGTLLRHGLLVVQGDGPLLRRRLVMPDAVAACLLPDAPALPDGVIALPLPGAADLPATPRLVVAGPGADALIDGGFAGPLWVAPQDRMSLDAARAVGVAAALAGVQVAHAGWDAAPEADRRALAASLGRHATILTARPDLWEGQGPAFALHAAQPAPQAARRAFWDALLPALADVLAAERLTPALQLWPLACAAMQDADPPARLTAMIAHLRAAPMQGLADPLPTPHDFDALILPAPAKARLRAFAGRRTSAVRVNEDWGLGPLLDARAGGIALFTGPSGTGKTMAAGVVARAAGLALWRINLATVVSKYIGETEANLERIFSAAGQAEVVLFFDEAEALFSRRAEVKDARDRYANMEMSYLLQRLEGFHGMAVLASNMGATMDPALIRRFDLVLDFALPDAAARRAIWARMERDGVPRAPDVDLDMLAARFDLAGGHIRQAILGAAHEAAQAGGAITQHHLLQAVAREYAKLGRSLRREDFGAAFAQVRGA